MIPPRRRWRLDGYFTADRERLTEPQLLECSCQLCAAWADHRAASARDLAETARGFE